MRYSFITPSHHPPATTSLLRSRSNVVNTYKDRDSLRYFFSIRNTSLGMLLVYDRSGSRYDRCRLADNDDFGFPAVASSDDEQNSSDQECEFCKKKSVLHPSYFFF